jgi:AdoMet-dependent heme synthase
MLRMVEPKPFSIAPLLVIWEVTRACALACQHCRASAEDVRDPGELSFEQGKRLLDDIAAMGTTLVVFTGGDPLQRDDLEDLVRYGKTLGLRIGTIPAATPRLTRERIVALKESGVDQMALSIDGESAARHDAFRRVDGTFAKVMEASRWIREAGIPLQANSVFGAWNVDDFDALAELVTGMGIMFWEVFFLVPTGRGQELQSCSAEQFEILFEKLHELSRRSPFVIKVTEGQHFRRWLAQHGALPGAGPPGASRIMASARPVNSGQGFCFVDHTGNVCPSGFLPIACGNVKETSIIDVYRNHPVFGELRDFSKLEGKCGACDYRDMCSGGSRARAYAMTGSYLASEPFCAYEPPSARV